MKNNPIALWEMKLEDGRQVNIRPISLEDIELEQAFFNQLSKESKHDRFLGSVTALSRQALYDLCDIDYLHDMAYVAVTDYGFNEKIVGVVRYVEDQSANKNAEIAVTVADDWQDRGIGSELLKKLIDFARQAGIKKLYSIDSYSNDKMKQLSKDFGFSKKSDPDDASLVIYELDITR